ncbi:AAA family ATPase [Nocardia altamirensis]|uniref:AAA family ATPase n=1 Tax=Nocardia altamirensis TaxID=472158 RepID=UPI000840568D|nr:AAA family ATPase [Nocardia altamirensis]
MRPLPVLWLTGAPGVGKSTVAWAMYSWAKDEGRPIAYIEIDQLGLLAPAPSNDPQYHRVKADNLRAVLDTFRSHGVQQVIVSGVVDQERGIDGYFATALDIEFTLVRLRCDRTELRRRYLGRGSSEERLEELMSVADAYDQNAVGIPFDTTALAPHEIVAKLSELVCVAGQPHSTAATPAEPPTTGAPAPVLVLAGPTAVGKSTVGFEVLRMLWSRDLPAAYIDVDQLGFCDAEFAREAMSENLIRLWHGYRQAGARALIVVARGIPRPYLQALADQSVTLVHLTASPSGLAKRIASRAHGHPHGDGPGLAGDSLIGASAEQQASTLDRSAEETIAVRQDGDGALVVDTDHETSSALAARLADLFRLDLRA